MKKFILVFIYANILLASNAQVYQLSGKVVEENGNPVEFAEILLLQNNIALQYQLSDEAGKFEFKMEPAKVSLLIRQLGDTLYYKEDIDVVNSIDLGVIKVQHTIRLLQEVTIIAKKKLMERKPDRMVFNVTDLSSVDGGDAMEILHITPGIIVDNNTIAIAGKSSVNVMINDRPVNLSGDELVNFLKSLRANDVRRIEVITTPPAKYDAEGNSGLINIVMKKITGDSWNGSVFGNYQQTKYASGSIGGNFNYRKNALSFYANASYNGGKSYMEDEGAIFYPELKWKNKGDYTRNSDSFSARTGFDVRINDKWTVGAQYIGSLGNTKSKAGSRVDLFEITDNNKAGLINTHSDGKTSFDMHSGNFFSVIQIDTLGRKINLDFDVLAYNANSDATYKSSTEGSTSIQIPNGFASENNILDRKITNYAAQIDVEHPINNFNLNYGVKLSFTNTDNNIQVYNLTSGAPVNNSNQTNQFLYEENTQAFYSSGSTQLGQWALQIGLRAENTQFTGNSVTMDTVFKKSYLEIFPTAYLSYNYNEKNIFYGEYGRRINRPNYDHLNPFRSYSSPYYYFTGNPELRPVFTNNLSIGYVYNYQLQLALDYSMGKDNFGGGISILDKDDYTQVGTRINYFDDYSIGTSIVYIFNKLNWWMSQTAANVYYQRSDSKIYPLTPKSSEGYGAYFQTYNIFYFNKEQTLSAGFDFTFIPENNSTTLMHNYTRKNLNAFVKMLFFEKTFSVTLTGNNLLKEYSFNWRGESNGILQYSKGYYDPLFLRLAVSYNFGSNKVKVQQHKISNEEEKCRVY